jgi:hypothetical protein
MSTEPRAGPAWARALASLPVQIWEGLRKPSLITVPAMLSLVIAMGSSGTEETALIPL